MARRAPVTVYFIMVDVPGRGWIRVGERSMTKEHAQDWRLFVKSAWHGLPTKVKPCRITFNEDGTVSARSKDRLDKVFNCDVTVGGK